MRRKRITALAAALTASAMALTACGGSSGSDSSSNSAGGGNAAAGSLEVFSWWTSGSESTALEVLFAATKAQDSGLEIINAAVSGGGGATARQALATRLQGGNPPDSWQLHPDQDLYSTVDDGSVADLTSLYAENGWEGKLPKQIDDMVKKDGKYYAVPVNAHRANVLWTNPKVLEQAGVSWTEDTTLTAFMADLDTIKAAGVTPLCLGDKDIFASAQLLESVMISELGADGWRGLATGETPFDGPEAVKAVTDYATLLGLANSDHTGQTWGQAVADMADGKCAATLMGDWAYGELVNKGKKEGTDFTYVAFPGTAKIFDFVGDAFVMPAENGPNPEAEKIWLTQLLDSTVQKDFNLAKGSSPVRTDVALDDFPPYQKAAVESLRNDEIVSSLAHGEIAPAEFVQSFADAVTAFNGDQNVESLTSTMASAQKTQLTTG